MRKKTRIGLPIRTLLALLSVALLLGGAIGGTMAWLTSSSAEVKNTFTPSNINITLTETTGDTYQMVPGKTITKDPVVTVLKDSEDCWLFVEIKKSDNFDDFMTYEIAEGWTKLNSAPGVYYREVDKTSDSAEFPVLKDDKVTVRDSVTKDRMDGLVDGTVDEPTLTFTAYAVQKEAASDAATAWTKRPTT